MIRDVVKSSGINRIGFVGREDSSRFWITFILSGLYFAFSMQLFFLIFGMYDISTLFDPFWFMMTAFLFVGFGVPMGIVVRLTGWRSPQRAKRAVLSIGYCPACAYRLFDIEAEPDGCTVCPECGGAWRLCENTTVQ